jgi:hypothetical protein
MEKQKIKHSQCNIEREEQTERAAITWLQDLLQSYYYSTQGDLGKKQTNSSKEHNEDPKKKTFINIAK